MYHFEFTVPSVLILLILLGYFVFRPRLPVRRNRLFFGLLFLQIATILFDVLSSSADMNYDLVALPVLVILNMGFFVLFLARMFWFFLYTLNLLRRFPTRSAPGMWLSAAVFLACELLSLSSAWTGAIFRVDAQGYHRGPLYGAIYVCFGFYLLLSFGLIALHHSHLSSHELAGVIGYNAILTVGIIVRMLMPQYLVMNTFCLMALIVISLNFENPARYTTVNGSFTIPALSQFAEERVSRNNYRMLGIALRNYTDTQAVYGFKQVEQGVALIEKYLQTAYPHLSVFYLRVGCFALGGLESLDVQRIADEIGERFRQPWIADETELYLNVAFVHLSSASGIQSAEVLMESLMLALYDAGEREGADNQLFDVDGASVLEHGVAVKRALEHAIEENSVEVFLQPLVDARSGALVAAEALARLRDEHGGLIPPDEFVPVAEKNGQINRLGEQVLEKVCDFIQTYGMKELGLKWINVNLSPVQCMNRELCSHFTGILEQHQVPPHLVHLEVTEASMIDYSVLMEQMSELWKAGFCFALDDYGSGYSNLSRVKRFPFSNIKLDKEIVWAHCKDPDQVLPTFIEVFREKGFTITAEGIETEEMAEEMREIGCDYLQGYHYAEPLPIPAFLEKYAPDRLCAPS